jgi:hypothetical protein
VMCGVLIVCVTTAALGRLVLFSSNEVTARAIMEREKSREILRSFAVSMISLWWRQRRGRSKITKRQRKMELYGYRREFVAAQQMLRVEVEQCTSISTKIEQISSRTRYMSECIDQVGINLFSSKLLAGKKSPRARGRKSPRAQSRRTSVDGMELISRALSASSVESRSAESASNDEGC